MGVAFLKQNGFEIIERNWRHRRAEIDIIAKDNNVLVFVEVKYKSSGFFGKPEDTVKRRQKMLIADAAAAYTSKVGYEWAVRFDILGVLEIPGLKPEITLYKDVYFPE